MTTPTDQPQREDPQSERAFLSHMAGVARARGYEGLAETYREDLSALDAKLDTLENKE